MNEYLFLKMKLRQLVLDIEQNPYKFLTRKSPEAFTNFIKAWEYLQGTHFLESYQKSCLDTKIKYLEHCNDFYHATGYFKQFLYQE